MLKTVMNERQIFLAARSIIHLNIDTEVPLELNPLTGVSAFSFF